MTDRTGGAISRKTIDYIFKAMKVAIATKCDDVLFDDYGISGRALETNILIMQPLDYDFEFTALGIGRPADLHNRLRLIIDDDNLTASFEEFREGKVGKLHFKTKKTKIEFKCKDPALVKTNKVLKDPIYFTFPLSADAIKFMNSGTTAMRNKAVTFKLKDGEVFIRLIDSEGDILDHDITQTVEMSEVCDKDEFSFSYDFPKLTSLLSAHKEITTVNITKRGLMNLSSEGFSIYLVPEF